MMDLETIIARNNRAVADAVRARKAEKVLRRDDAETIRDALALAEAELLRVVPSAGQQKWLNIPANTIRRARKALEAALRA